MKVERRGAERGRRTEKRREKEENVRLPIMILSQQHPNNIYTSRTTYTTIYTTTYTTTSYPYTTTAYRRGQLVQVSAHTLSHGCEPLWRIKKWSNFSFRSRVILNNVSALGTISSNPRSRPTGSTLYVRKTRPSPLPRFRRSPLRPPPSLPTLPPPPPPPPPPWAPPPWLRRLSKGLTDGWCWFWMPLILLLLLLLLLLVPVR